MRLEVQKSRGDIECEGYIRYQHERSCGGRAGGLA